MCAIDGQGPTRSANSRISNPNSISTSASDSILSLPPYVGTQDTPHAPMSVLSISMGSTEDREGSFVATKESDSVPSMGATGDEEIRPFGTPPQRLSQAKTLAGVQSPAQTDSAHTYLANPYSENTSSPMLQLVSFQKSRVSATLPTAEDRQCSVTQSKYLPFSHQSLPSQLSQATGKGVVTSSCGTLSSNHSNGQYNVSTVPSDPSSSSSPHGLSVPVNQELGSSPQPRSTPLLDREPWSSSNAGASVLAQVKQLAAGLHNRVPSPAAPSGSSNSRNRQKPPALEKEINDYCRDELVRDHAGLAKDILVARGPRLKFGISFGYVRTELPIKVSHGEAQYSGKVVSQASSLASSAHPNEDPLASPPGPPRLLSPLQDPLASPPGPPRLLSPPQDPLASPPGPPRLLSPLQDPLAPLLDPLACPPGPPRFPSWTPSLAFSPPGPLACPPGPPRLPSRTPLLPLLDPLASPPGPPRFPSWTPSLLSPLLGPPRLPSWTPSLALQDPLASPPGPPRFPSWTPSLALLDPLASPPGPPRLLSPLLDPLAALLDPLACPPGPPRFPSWTPRLPSWNPLACPPEPPRLLSPLLDPLACPPGPPRLPLLDPLACPPGPPRFPSWTPLASPPGPPRLPSWTPSLSPPEPPRLLSPLLDPSLALLDPLVFFLLSWTPSLAFSSPGPPRLPSWTPLVCLSPLLDPLACPPGPPRLLSPLLDPLACPPGPPRLLSPLLDPLACSPGPTT
eukprot:gene9192-16331_t